MSDRYLSDPSSSQDNTTVASFANVITVALVTNDSTEDVIVLSLLGFLSRDTMHWT